MTNLDRKEIFIKIQNNEPLDIRELRMVENALVISECIDKIMNESIGIEDNGFGLVTAMKYDKKERLVTSDEDCADCLCRVCARNRCNDSYNRKSEEDGRSCECNCKIGDKLIETEDDCPEFLPDEDN